MDLPRQVAAFSRSRSWHEEILGAGGAGNLDELLKRRKKITTSTDDNSCCSVESCTVNSVTLVALAGKICILSA